MKNLYSELKQSFKKHNSPSILLLWILVSIPSVIIAWEIVDWRAAVGVAIIILIGRFYNMQTTAFLTVFSVLIAASNLSQQNIQLSIQSNQIRLDRRPYLFINYDYRYGERENDTLFGALLTFYNSGKFPASDLKTEYLVCDDTGNCPDFKKWYADTYGSFPEFSVVPPSEKTGATVYIPGIKKNATLGCIGVLVSYKGLGTNEEYWFKRMDIFRIVKENGKSEPKLISRKIEWDQDMKYGKPSLTMPDWNSYLRK